LRILPASQFTLETLTEAYNQTRIDYIVPMPMNVARLEAYIDHYDVNLEDSAVAVLDDDILGLSMLGVRGERTWITRLGVLPNKRRCGAGEALMHYLIDRSRQRGAQKIILEVIKNNWPAFYLFKKLGFVLTRELLVLRRPPHGMEVSVPSYTLETFGSERAEALLAERKSHPSWLDERPSLKNAGHLEALRVTLDGSETGQTGEGWLVYQHELYQLGRLVIQPETGDSERVTCALIHALHTLHPYHDTKFENLPVESAAWPVLETFGYLAAFRRLEMSLDLRSLPAESADDA
jgi:ribosomal protein S18 acetylase RimI-like enzyme